MRVTSAYFREFKRFKSLTIKDLPEAASLVMLVGPNGSGKSSVFDGFLQWQRKLRYGPSEEQFEYWMRGSDALKQRNEIFQNQVEIGFTESPEATWEGRRAVFYFRSAYRFEGSFTITGINRPPPILEEQRLPTMSHSDVSVSNNYIRLAGKLIDDLHSKVGDDLPKGQWRDKQYSTLQTSIARLFNGLKLDSPGNPFDEGTLLFTKGDIKKFKYANLSSGEKSALDLLLDLFIRGSSYKGGVYCVDEPEAHMNPNLHGALLEEIYNLVLEQDGQLWVATHSIGMIRKAIDLAKTDPEKVIFLDFHDLDFDQATTLVPAKVNTSFWSRNLRGTLADLSELVAPRQVILCEGARADSGAKKAEFDAQCYQTIFEKEFPDALFISVGASNDIITGGAALRGIIKRMTKGVEVISLIDRDDRTDGEVADAQRSGHRVLPQRHIEHYLLADEVLEKLCRDYGKPEAAEIIIAGKTKAIKKLPDRNLPPDDIKRAKGEIFNAAKVELKSAGQRLGSNADAFCRDILAPRIEPGMAVYNELRMAIFGI